MKKIINVMWLCSKPSNEYLKEFNKHEIYYGSWIDSILSIIKKSKKIHVDYVFFVSNKEIYQEKQIDDVNYYPVLNDKAANIILKKNDILHVFGTENKKNNDFILKYGNNKTIVWLQGFISECAKSYLKNINEVVNKEHIQNGFLTKITIYINYLLFNRRKYSEIKVLKKVKYVSGRTNWDKKISLSINPNLVYYYCQEALRDCFYGDEKWKSKNHKKHSIYISQASYPIKGFHTIISSLGLIAKMYPDVSIRIGGENIIKSDNLLTRIGINYASLIKKLIKQNNLTDKIEFLGPIGPKQVKKELLECNVFLLCSNVENGCNALREAMITGTPIVSADIEGVKSTEFDKFISYYKDDNEFKNVIIKEFNNKTSLEKTTTQIQVAKYNYDKNQIMKDLEKIYLEIYERKI